MNQAVARRAYTLKSDIRPPEFDAVSAPCAPNRTEAIYSMQ